MIKKIFKLLFEPLNFLANRNFAEKISVYFNKNKWASVLLAILLTIILFVLLYLVPNIVW